mgnify:CR=1 FL=1
MAVKKGGLGRGLESLFEDAARDVGGPVSTLPLREIEPDKDCLLYTSDAADE